MSGFTTIARNVTITFAPDPMGGGIRLTGDVLRDPSQDALILVTDEGVEDLSVNLLREGFLAGPGCVFVPDWSKHRGIAAGLEAAGVGSIIRTVTIGPFKSVAHEVELAQPASEVAAA